MDSQPAPGAGGLSALLKEFIATLKSPCSQKAYRTDMLAFFDWCRAELVCPTKSSSKEALKQAVLTATRDELARYHAFLKQLTYAPRTVNRKVSTLRAFYKWLCANGHRGDNPSRSLRLMAFQPESEVLREDEIDRLVAAIVGQGSVPVKDRALVTILADCGIKLAELLALNLNDLQFDNQTGEVRFEVPGNTSLEPLSQRASSALKDYLCVRPTRSAGEDEPLFINKHGTRLSSRSVRRKLAAYTLRAGISAAASPRMLRRTLLASR